MDTSEEVLILGRHILHAYIEDMDIEPLIDHLAPDVVWLGAGREMNAVGRDRRPHFPSGKRPADSLPHERRKGIDLSSY